MIGFTKMQKFLCEWKGKSEAPTGDHDLRRPPETYPKTNWLSYEDNDYEGYIDEITATVIRGWAVNKLDPNSPIEIGIYEEDKLLKVVTTSQFREDLKDLQKGNGYHGFEFEIPGALQDRRYHLLHIRYMDNAQNLYRSPIYRQFFPDDPAGNHQYLISQQINTCKKNKWLGELYLQSDFEFRKNSFPQTDEKPWLDDQDWKATLNQQHDLSETDRQLCEKFATDGYVVIKNVIPETELDTAWNELLDAWRSGRLPSRPRPPKFDPKWGRIGNIHNFVPAMRGILEHPLLIEKIELLLGVPCIPFQTIPSFTGSEQLAHSDAIHMTTYPLGYLAAAWIAFEDIADDSGPLEFYPGSHRLPYYLSDDTGMSLEDCRKGRAVYEQTYEPFIQSLIQKNNLEKKYFLARKGEILIWHHNLIHGGSPVKNLSSTRESLVCHYFGKESVCYHDLVGSLASL